MTYKLYSTHQHYRYVSGSENILCQSDDENEIEVDTKLNEVDNTEDAGVTSVTGVTSDTNTNEEENLSTLESSSELSTPILSVYHENGYRTVLTAIPASFGLTIDNDTEVRHIYKGLFSYKNNIYLFK